MKKSVTSAAMTAALAAVLATPALAQNTAPSSGAGNWPVYNGNPTSTRFSPLNEINAGNVQTLTHQYVAFPSGLGGFGGAFIAQLWTNMADYPQGATLVAFRLK